MITRLVEKIQSRVAFKLAFWVVILSMFITLLTSLIQLYVSYQRDLDSLNTYFESITSMQINSLTQSVWTMNDVHIQALLDGVTKPRDIIYAAVLLNGEVLWSSGDKNASKIRELSYELNYSHRNKIHNLGTLQIVASLEVVHERLLQTAKVVLLTNGLQIFLFAGCILLLFRNQVTNHLEKLASHVVNIDFRKKSSSIKLDRHTAGGEDEFSQVVSMLNILQRRGHNAFNAMDRSMSRLQLFFDATEEGIFGINSEGRITFANSTCLTKLGAANSYDIVGKKVDELLQYSSKSDPYIKSSKEMFLQPLHIGNSLISDDGYLLVKGGPAFYAGVRTYPIVSGDIHSGAVVFFNDISEKRGIIQEKNLLSQAVRQSPLLVIISDGRGFIEYVNPGFEQLTGYTQRKVLGKKAYFLGHHKRNRKVFQRIQECLLRGKKWQGIYYVRAADGAEYCFDSLVSPVFNSSGKIINIIALCLDITQKVDLQNQLLHAQKMEAVGRLSASFAHEFGNPLLGVRSVIKDIGERVAMDETDKQLLELAYSECERMKTLIRDFQRFHSSGSGTKQHEDIHDIIDNVLFFYKKHFENNNIVAKKNYQADIPLLMVSRDQIAQVFLNLIINAVDAMKDGGGILEISTRRVDDEVHIDLKDTGTGIGEMEKDLIFEPFYTTKSEIQGSGLGLSVSYGIITGHGGNISVSSIVNEGSTFTIHLPINPFKN